MKWLPEELHWIVGATSFWSPREIREVRNVWGMNMSFRREAFELCGGFVMRMSDCFQNNFAQSMLTSNYRSVVPHEDVDLSIKIVRKTGKRIVYNPNVRVLHRAKKSRLRFRFIIEEALHQGCAKRMINRIYNEDKSKNNLLRREYDLLLRTFTRLLPRTIIRFPKDPYNSWRQFSITMVALFFLGLGYCHPAFFKLFRRKKHALIQNQAATTPKIAFKSI